MVKEQKVITIDLDYVNSFLIVGQETILIDCGNPGDAENILAKMEKLGIDNDDISLILITHGHIDHYGGAHELKKEIDADIAVHKDDADAVKKGINKPIKSWNFKGRFLKNFLSNKHAKGVDPDLKFEELELMEYGVEGKAISTPGHTPGSASVLLDTGQAIIGDLMMGGLFRSQRPKLPTFANDIEKVKESLKKIYGYEPKRLYASHGGPFESSSLKKYS